MLELGQIRQLFHSSFTPAMRDGAFVSVGGADDCYWSITKFPTSSANELSIYNGSSQTLEAALTKFYEADLPHRVFLGGAGLIHAQALLAKGYVQEEAVPLMALALDGTMNQHQLRDGLTITRVRTAEELALCQALMVDAFSASPEFTISSSSHTLGNVHSFRYLLRDQGLPVSTAHLIQSGEFLGCFEVVTATCQQGAGYGEQLMRWMIATHAALGQELMVLQSSSAGEALYRGLGFQILEYAQCWVMKDVSLVREFSHGELAG